jgi:hypothetical protein
MPITFPHVDRPFLSFMLYPPVVQIPSDKFPQALHRPARAARLAGSLAHKEAISVYVHKTIHNHPTNRRVRLKPTLPRIPAARAK